MTEDRIAYSVSGNAIDAAKAARAFMAAAIATEIDAGGRMARALTSIAASLVHANEESVPSAEFLRQSGELVQHMQDKLDAARAILTQAASDQPEHEIRWLRAFLDGQEFPDITPEEPEPGRDWSRVRAFLFNPNGKFKYQVWLDYTGERVTVDPIYAPGVGPHGWHWDGHEMAKRALHRATTNGTSEVTISALGAYWHLFVPDPPQGFPHWVQPERDLSAGNPLQEATEKLNDIRALCGTRLAGAAAEAVLEVLDR